MPDVARPEEPCCNWIWDRSYWKTDCGKNYGITPDRLWKFCPLCGRTLKKEER